MKVRVRMGRIDAVPVSEPRGISKPCFEGFGVAVAVWAQRFIVGPRDQLGCDVVGCLAAFVGADRCLVHHVFFTIGVSRSLRCGVTLAAMAVIDLDRPVEARPVDVSAPAPVVPFSVWLRGWAPLHPVRVGVVLASVVTLVALLVWLVAVATRPVAPERGLVLSGVTPGAVALSAAEGAEVARVTLYPDGDGRVLRSGSSGELFGPDPLVLTDGPAGVVLSAVTVAGVPSSCSITVDGRLVADEVAPAGGSVLCVWLAPPGLLVVAPSP